MRTAAGAVDNQGEKSESRSRMASLLSLEEGERRGCKTETEIRFGWACRILRAATQGLRMWTLEPLPESSSTSYQLCDLEKGLILPEAHLPTEKLKSQWY